MSMIWTNQLTQHPVVLAIAVLWLVPAQVTFAQPQSTDAPTVAAKLEFFEKEVRPILVNRCYQCHSTKAKKLQGGFHLDSRASLIKGGDTGPAIVPFKPDESLLIDAINYGDLYEMPPKSKLPKAEIDTLTRWVALGAPWPTEANTPAAGNPTFDLAKRRASHWSWSPLRSPSVPDVKPTNWPLDPLDHFVLSRLNKAGLVPAQPADKRTLIRRAYFDVIGLPPTIDQIEAFLRDESADAFARVVDELLDSPHFGERWARHWLDLARYAESRGHEFDYTTPNAHHYRDYVIRAINADLPYRQFAIEHVAGDLLASPRLHPESGANESILATGFWFLGEWVHSPVDIRKDETNRFDNMLDVFSKTFLGLTVACARCHDHKFDAISQADYYALAGFLQSSAYRQVRFESLDHNRKISEQAHQVKTNLGARIKSLALHQKGGDWDETELYLTAATEVLTQTPIPAVAQRDLVIDDFEDGEYLDWKIEGDAFNGIALKATEIAKHQGNVNAAGKFLINSHNKADASGKNLRSSDKWQGKITSPSFVIERDAIELLVGGGAHQDKTCVRLIVDNKVVCAATGKNNNRMEKVHWDVTKWRGKTSHIEILDQHAGGWGNIGVDQIVMTSATVEGLSGLSRESLADKTKKIASSNGLSPTRLAAWVAELIQSDQQQDHPLHLLAAQIHSQESVLTWCRAVDAQNSLAPAAFDNGTEISNFMDSNKAPLIQDGVSFGAARVQAGDMLVIGDTIKLANRSSARRDVMFYGLRLVAGVERESGKLSKWDRAGKTLRTSTFVMEAKPLYYLVRGRGLAYGVVASHRMIHGPLHGSLLHEFDTKNDTRWLKHDLQRYAGENAHIEFVPFAEEPLEILAVIQSDKPPPLPDQWDQADHQLSDVAKQNETDLLVKSTVKAIRDSVQRINENSSDTATARDWQRASFLVTNSALQDSAKADQIEAAKKQLVAEIKKLSGQVKKESRTALAMWDGTSTNEQLLIRGNNKTPGKIVPRRMLTALNGQTTRSVTGSGRLQLADDLFHPENPYPARVFVNRIWHHLMGRGIVASTDNFGVMGQPPSHPRLLDHLATRLVDQGWSQKQLIRSIMLSQTYRMSSDLSDAGTRVDPENLLLHRMRIRRMQGEIVRDWMLATSSRLEPKFFGPSIPVHLTSFMQGRGKPKSGPVDGNGRRSVYISIRRNFLSPMMLAFDAPQPFSTVGRRSVSNVPAQALIMMNDPLVAELANQWSKKLLSLKLSSNAQQIERLYMEAFSRPPSHQETQLAIAFLKTQARELKISEDKIQTDQRLWSDLCHVLFNMKELVFVR